MPDLFRAVPVDVRAGSRFRVTAKVRVSGGTVATVALGWHDASGAYTGGVQSGRAPAGSGWSTVTVTGTARAGTRTVDVHLEASGGNGPAWFDDVVVEAL